MRDGIPPYRLARDVLDGEIARIVALGVDVRLQRDARQTPRGLERLRAEFDAVYRRHGRAAAEAAAQLDYGSAVGDGRCGIAAAANAGAPPALGARLVVIGGGSAALDVARSARRAGHEVTILALEARAQMPAQREEVEEALEEGIALVDGAMLVGAPGRRRGAARVRPRAFRARRARGAIHGDAGRRQRIHAVRRRDRDVDRPGPGTRRARSARPADGALLVADAAGRRRASSASRPAATSRAWRASSPRRSAWASARRRRSTGAARATGRRREGARHVTPGEPRRACRWRRSPRTTTRSSRAPAARRLAPRDAAGGGAEVQLGLDVEQALAEAGALLLVRHLRPLRQLLRLLPRHGGQARRRRLPVLGDYCKGCGLCVKECPTGSMEMVEEAR